MDANRLDFAPPPEPAAVRGFVLAILAHLLLMIALTWGINWKRESDTAAVEAELWSSVPREAAPAAVQPPQVVQAPPLPPAPVEKVAPPPPVTNEPDIALEREKKRLELAKQREEELERQKKLEARKKLEEAKRKEAAEQKAAEEARRRDELAKAAKDKARQQADAKKLEAQRKENIARMMKGLDGGTGAPTSTGTGKVSSGATSAGYGARVQARVRPYIVFPEDMPGNPQAEVEVRLAPDGTIVSSRIIQPSGTKMWDDAVLAALAKAEALPRDVDGRVPTPLVIVFKRRP